MGWRAWIVLWGCLGPAVAQGFTVRETSGPGEAVVVAEGRILINGYRSRLTGQTLGGWQRSSDGSWLISGRDEKTGEGVLTAVRFRRPWFEPVWKHVALDADFTGVAYDETAGRLYVLDAKQPRILVASYRLGDPAPRGWRTFVGTAALSALDTEMEYRLGVGPVDLERETTFELELEAMRRWKRAERAGEQPPRALWLLAKDLAQSEFEDNFSIDLTATEPVILRHPGHKHHLQIESLPAWEGAETLTLSGPADTWVQVLRTSDGAMVGAAKTNEQGLAEVQVGSLVIGEVYVPASDVHPEGTDFRVTPVRRFGTAERLPGGELLRWGGFMSSGSLSWGLPQVEVEPVPRDRPDVVLAFGLPEDIEQIGKRTLLRPRAMWRGRPRVAPCGTQTEVFFDAQWPRDERLTGHMLCWQAWVLVGAEDVRLSDVIGITVHATAREKAAGIPIGGVLPTAPRPSDFATQGAVAMAFAEFPVDDAVVERVRAAVQR